MIRTVKLYGEMAEKFGDTHSFNADYFSTLVNGVDLNSPGFKQYLTNNNVSVLKDNSTINSEEECKLTLGNTNTIHIFPEIEGKSRGLLVVVGIALIATGVGAAAGGATLGAGLGATTALGISAGTAILLGASLVVSSMMQPPKLGDATQAESADNKPSFMYNGAVNVIEQGGPVPVVFGRFRVGSTVISAGIDVEQIEAYNT